MKLKILERLQKLGSDMFITDYAGDIVNLLVNKQKEYRFLYDAQADLYMICNAFDYIHSEMVEQAFKKVLLIAFINNIDIVKYNDKLRKDNNIQEIRIIILLKIKYDFLL